MRKKSTKVWTVLLVLAGVMGVGTQVLWSERGCSASATRVIYTHRDDAQGQAVSKAIGNEIIYQIVVDRFANGNSNNDCLYDGRFCSPNHSDWFKFWGGDVRGVIDHVPYLHNLGVSRLWLTPIFENQLVTVPRSKFGRHVEISAYHGYWIRDWWRLSPLFTDRGKQDYALVDELVQTSGVAGLKVYLDTVVNHSSPWDASTQSLNYLSGIEPLGSSADGINRSHRGAVFQDGHYVMGFDEDGVRRNRIAGYVPFFNHNPSITDWNNLEQVQNFSLDGLSDLNQGGPLAQGVMRDAHNFWLDRFPGLAGYRMDSIKHVPLSYWRQFSREVLETHPDREAIGEYYAAGLGDQNSVDFYRQTRFTMFDFDFRNGLQSVFKDGASFSTLVNLWSRDGAYGDARALVTFLDSHDMPRMRGTGMNLISMKMALATMFMARGIPCLLYGMEQDLFVEGDPGDPYNRPMMERFDGNSEMFQWVSRLAHVRRSNEAMRYGDTSVVHQSDNILAFERSYGDQFAFFAVSKNRRQGTDDFRISGLRLSDGEYIDRLSGKRYVVSQGGIDVQLGYGDVIVLSNR